MHSTEWRDDTMSDNGRQTRVNDLGTAGILIRASCGWKGSKKESNQGKGSHGMCSLRSNLSLAVIVEAMSVPMRSVANVPVV
jgi:hypothetical protein